MIIVIEINNVIFLHNMQNRSEFLNHGIYVFLKTTTLP